MSATASRPSTRTMASLATPKRGMHPTMTWCNAAFVRAASLPPFSRRPLPLRMASEAIWGSASGRDSKMMSNTPRGAVTCSRMRSGAISILLRGRAIGSSIAAICLAPSASCAIFPGLSFRRFIRLGSVFAASAAAMSSTLAATIAGSFASSASAMAHRSAERSALDRAWSWRLAARAATAWSRVDMVSPSCGVRAEATRAAKCAGGGGRGAGKPRDRRREPHSPLLARSPETPVDER